MLMTDYQNEESDRKHALEDFMSVTEAMRHSGYTDQYLRRMAKEGRIHAIKIAQFWLFSRRSLQAFMDYASSKGQKDNRFGPKKSR